MRFSYESYVDLIQLLRETGYQFASYDNFAEYDKCAILRHDVDFKLQDAGRLASVEQKEGIRSTYFVLLTSDFYNVFSRNSRSLIDGIRRCGHEIGLHFDEARYPEEMGNIDLIRKRILEEAGILAKAVGEPVTKVSMHRPSKNILRSNLGIPGMVNTYSDQFLVHSNIFRIQGTVGANRLRRSSGADSITEYKYWCTRSGMIQMRPTWARQSDLL